MQKLDIKHIVFHTLIAVYFIWLVVYASLITIALINAFGNGDAALAQAFTVWIFFNLLMGSILFIVIRLYTISPLLNRILLYSYCGIATAAIATVLFIYGSA